MFAPEYQQVTFKDIQDKVFWKFTADEVLCNAFYYHSRSQRIESIPLQYSSTQVNKLILEVLEVSSKPMMYGLLSSTMAADVQESASTGACGNSGCSVEAVYIDPNTAVTDPSITSSQFGSIGKSDFEKYDSMQSYINELIQNTSKPEDLKGPADTNAMLFILFLSVIVIILGMVVIVMMMYIHFMNKSSPEASLHSDSLPSSPVKPSNNTSMNYCGEQFTCSKTVLGHGSLGTVVFEGTAGGKRVAVKRMVKEFYSIAQNELNVIGMTDEKPHLVRYYGSFADEHFIYLAITYCPYTLEEYLEYIDGGAPMQVSTKCNASRLNPERIRLMKECAIGVYYLHQLGIVHRDIKPLNVLVDVDGGIRITDFGLAKTLDPQSSSFSNSMIKGSAGWQAPEMIKNTKRLSKAVDIFTLGCLFYYIATRQHPYGDTLLRQTNIIKGNCTPMSCDNNNIYQSEFIACFNGMNKQEPEKRMSIAEVLAQPLFWPLKKRLEFLQTSSDLIIAEKNVKVSRELDAAGVGIRWDRELSPIILNSIDRYRVYDYAHTIDLLRVIRNQSHHYFTLVPEEKALYGSYPDGFYTYYHSHFPTLFIVMYNIVKKYYRNNTLLMEFFTPTLN